MPENVVIVESPAKAKTIKGFLGNDFEVVSSFGHIADLPEKEMGIDIENNFTPKYQINPDKKDIVKKLKSLTDKANYIWLASDEDREGEAISWHLFNNLNLDQKKTKRIVFHEITKIAILKSIENPRDINYNLVNAQQARRVLDRLVGYEMSPVLWTKVKRGLSAGRVQSVAVRLIVEREKEIKKFIEEPFYRIIGNFISNKNEKFKSLLDFKFTNEKDVINYLEKIKNGDFIIASIETKPTKRKPSPPFTTSTLQQEASRKFGYSVSQTMRLAQILYENGHITYMRTDSVNLSNDAKDQISKEIEITYGKEYVYLRDYKTKSKSAQEAHEAIRPTLISEKSISIDDNSAKKLYELIWKRTISSQMSEASLDKTTIKIKNDKTPYLFISEGEVITFDGFLKIYKEGTDEEEKEDIGLLPLMKKGDSVSYEKIICNEKKTKHPPRYTEASLVKKMEDLGIGRPSTYAPTISTIQKRNYVEKKDLEGYIVKMKEITLDKNSISELEKEERTSVEKSKLFPTDIGTIVNDYLTEAFDRILDYNFTAKIEEQFDDIAQGNEIWTNIISSFYKDFHDDVENAKNTKGKFVGERILGTDPKSGKPVSVRIGRFGAMAQIGTKDDDEKPKFASLKKNQSIDTITLEEALDLYKLPRLIGRYNNIEIIGAIGRFGPYIKYDNLFISIKDIDIFDITLEQSIEKIKEKIEQNNNKIILVFDEKEPKIEVLNGRFGPYIKIGKDNIKIPKDIDPKSLTREKCLELKK